MIEPTATDPVCGTVLDTTKVQFITDYEGVRYYFCSEKCKHRFDLDPETYLNSELAAPSVPE